MLDKHAETKDLHWESSSGTPCTIKGQWRQFKKKHCSIAFKETNNSELDRHDFEIHHLQGLANVQFWGVVSRHLKTYLLEIIL